MSDVTDHTLPRGTPEAHGIPSAAIDAFVTAAEREVAHLHSLMLLRHGHVLAAGWWEPCGSPMARTCPTCSSR